jgi:MFS family permease
VALSPRSVAHPAPAVAEPRLSAAGQRFRQTFQALANREFRFLWVGTLGGFTAMQMQTVAFGFLAYELTGSAVVLGLVSLATGVTQLLCGLFSGTIVDRLPKRRLLLITQSALGTIALINFLLVAAGVIQLWQLFFVALTQGAVFAFNMPGRQAFIGHLARSPAELHNAIALHNAGMNLTRVVGPSIAGVILGLPGVGVAAVFFAMTASYAAGVFSFLFIKNPGAVGERRSGSVLGEIAAGWRYIFRDPVLRSLLLLSFASSVLGMPFQILMPVYALRVFEVGSLGLGLLLTATGVGALAGALATAYLSDSERKGRFLFVTSVLLGLAIIAFALAPSVWLALPGLLLAGACSSVVLSLGNALLIANADPVMHGRVMSAYMMSFALFPLGVLPTGALADTLGPRPALVIGGAILTGITLGLYLRSPSLRRLR